MAQRATDAASNVLRGRQQLEQDPMPVSPAPSHSDMNPLGLSEKPEILQPDASDL